MKAAERRGAHSRLARRLQRAARHLAPLVALDDRLEHGDVEGVAAGEREDGEEVEALRELLELVVSLARLGGVLELQRAVVLAEGLVEVLVALL